MKLAPLSPLFLLALAGCHRSAPGYTPVPPPPIEPVSTKEVHKSTDLMALEVGNQWTYTMRSQAYDRGKLAGSAESTGVYRVVSIAPNGDAVMTLEQDGKVVDRQVWRSNERGLYQVSSGLDDALFDPPQPIAILPLTPGERTAWQGRGPVGNGTVARGRMESETLPPQKVDTGLGPLSAFPVASHASFGGSSTVNTTWFRPGVGLVRLRQENYEADGNKSVLTLVLSNYSLKR